MVRVNVPRLQIVDRIRLGPSRFGTCEHGSSIWNFILEARCFHLAGHSTVNPFETRSRGLEWA